MDEKHQYFQCSGKPWHPFGTGAPGEAFIIFDQDKPVARLEPVGQIQIAEPDKVRLEMLAAKGLVQPAQTALDWGSLPDPVNPLGNVSAVEKLLADREGL